MPKQRMPFMLGRGSLAPQWDAIKDDVVGPEAPAPIDTDEQKPSNFLGEIVATIKGNKTPLVKPPLRGITHAGDE